jgi:hypothetical protein
MKTTMMSKHYIYEIFGRKIGSTQDIKRRMKEQKVEEGEYRIIEEHSNAKICSIREIELQKEFNYPVDRIQYWKTLRNQKKALTPRAQKKRIANTDFKAKAANTDYSNIRPPKSAYTPEGIAKRTKSNSKPVNQSDLKDNFIKRWDSAIDAAREFFNDRNCQSNITACCKGKQKTHKNYKWEYAG